MSEDVACVTGSQRRSKEVLHKMLLFVLINLSFTRANKTILATVCVRSATRQVDEKPDIMTAVNYIDGPIPKNLTFLLKSTSWPKSHS